MQITLRKRLKKSSPTYTRNSPPGAAGAEGHPSCSQQVGRSQRASRVAHDVRYADVRPLRGRVEHGSNYEFGVSANSFMKFNKIESGLGRDIWAPESFIPEGLTTNHNAKWGRMGSNRPQSGLDQVWKSRETHRPLFIFSTACDSPS